MVLNHKYSLKVDKFDDNVLKAKIRRKLKSKEPLSWVLVALYDIEPATCSDVWKKLSLMSLPFDRPSVWGFLQTLSHLGLVLKIPFDRVIKENDEICNRIRKKIKDLNISPKFKPDFYCVTDFGESFFEWIGQAFKSIKIEVKKKS